MVTLVLENNIFKIFRPRARRHMPYFWCQQRRINRYSCVGKQHFQDFQAADAATYPIFWCRPRRINRYFCVGKQHFQDFQAADAATHAVFLVPAAAYKSLLLCWKTISSRFPGRGRDDIRRIFGARFVV